MWSGGMGALQMGALAVEQVAQRLEVSLDVLRADFSTVDPIRRCLPNILLQDLLHLSYKHGLGRSISTQSAVRGWIGGGAYAKEARQAEEKGFASASRGPP